MENQGGYIEHMEWIDRIENEWDRKMILFIVDINKVNDIGIFFRRDKKINFTLRNIMRDHTPFHGIIHNLNEKKYIILEKRVQRWVNNETI